MPAEDEGEGEVQRNADGSLMTLQQRIEAAHDDEDEDKDDEPHPVAAPEHGGHHEGHPLQPAQSLSSHSSISASAGHAGGAGGGAGGGHAKGPHGASNLSHGPTGAGRRPSLEAPAGSEPLFLKTRWAPHRQTGEALACLLGKTERGLATAGARRGP